MDVKTIKNIDDETWSSFKVLAVRNNMKVGQMFKILVEEYEKKISNCWENILSHKSILTSKESRELENTIEQARKEKGWRI